MKKLLHLSALVLLIIGTMAPAKSQIFDFLDINNVKARINSSGDLFTNMVDTTASFEVPKGSGKNTIFGSRLWIFGYDLGGNLKGAAQTYRRSGNDFFPGPIDTVTTTIDSVTMSDWNRVWKIDKSTIDSFASGLFTAIPPSILEWPGNGDATKNQVHFLAPFIDMDHDGIYNPQAGDYPSIRGDQAVFFIFNDVGGVHKETGGAQMGVEIHGMAYAFSASGNSALNNTVFVNYEIFNRTFLSWEKMYLGNWTDFDIGDKNDDYIGCDVARQSYYGYNGDSFDDTLNGGYGLNPPVQGVIFLKGPRADLGDAIDNDRDSCIDCTWLNNGAQMVAIPDTVLPEYIKMSKFMYYDSNFTVTGNPVSPIDYNNYMRGIWRDGYKILYGGNGKLGGMGATADTCDFMFPGDSDPNHWGTEGHVEQIWDEVTAGSAPHDVRGLGSSGPFTVLSRGYESIDYAYVFSQADSGGATASMTKLKTDIDSVQTFYRTVIAPNSVIGVREIKHSSILVSVFPNPTTDFVSISFELPQSENIDLRLTDCFGKEIKILADSKFNSGKHLVKLDDRLPAGIYFIKLITDHEVVTKRIIKY